MSRPLANQVSREDLLHVVPSPDGSWMVKRGGEPIPIQSFRLKQEAVSFARGQGDVVIHDRAKLSYARDSSGKLSRIKALPGQKPRPTFGSAAGMIRTSSDFDEPLEDFADYME